MVGDCASREYVACLAGLGAFLVWLNFRTGISRAQVGCLFVFFFLSLFYLFLTLPDLPCCLQTLVAVSDVYSPSRCAGFSMQWFLLLRNTGSRTPGLSSIWA